MAELAVSPPIDAAGNLSLRTLLDLSLGTPEPGAVNFNALHTLLAALLTKLDLNGMQIPASSVAGASNALVQAGAGLSTTTTTTVSVVGAGVMVGGLEAKVKSLEDQLKVLNALPTNSQLLDSVGVPPISLEAQSSPVTYMFQIMRLQKNVDTNSSGIDKVIIKNSPRASNILDNHLLADVPRGRTNSRPTNASREQQRPETSTRSRAHLLV